MAPLSAFAKNATELEDWSIVNEKKQGATLLLKTVVGSRLYGLNHAGSDYDLFEVYGWDKFRGKQKVGEIDHTRQSYDRFMTYCAKGVPQYLEAMWSRKAEVDNLPFNRFNFRPDLRLTRETYHRTVKNFWLRGWEESDFKLRRHALRLYLNYRTFEVRGWFNPTLETNQILFVNMNADNESALKGFLDE